MLVGDVEVGMRLKARWTYGFPVVVTRLLRDPATDLVTGFEYSYEETFTRQFRPPRYGTWKHEDMLHWEKLEHKHPQIGFSFT